MADNASKSKTLRWAIEELHKQREDFDAKLKVARKRDETNSLIEEVFAQKKALEQRISALEDGFKVSSGLVEEPCDELEGEIFRIDEKLQIAQERLHSLEQEEYLEELGRKLNRSNLAAPDDDSSLIVDGTPDAAVPSKALPSWVASESKDVASATESHAHSKEASLSEDNLASTKTAPFPLMKAKINRMPDSEEVNLEPPPASSPAKSFSKAGSLALSLEETAGKLGVEPDFLAEKATQAVLRMIARNDGKLVFPLEVDQID